MTDAELLIFIKRIREMCRDDANRISGALQTLNGVLERQHADEKQLKLIGQLSGRYESTVLAYPTIAVGDMNDIYAVIEKARRNRIHDESQRGCR